MGASWWQNFTPYQTDISLALNDLRWQAYRDNDFYDTSNDFDDDMSEDEFIVSLGGLDEDPNGAKLALLEGWRERTNLRRSVSSPDALLDAQSDTGTHSVIDLYEGVTTDPKPFTASPLTPEQLQDAFATHAPTRAHVDAWLAGDDPYSLRERWSGFYIVIYDSGAPSEILFAGFSGD